MMSQPVSGYDVDFDDTALKLIEANERFVQLAYCLRESVSDLPDDFYDLPDYHHDLPDDHHVLQLRKLEDFKHQALTLLKGVDVVSSPERGDLVWECALETGSKAIVEAVLDKGVDINAVDHQGRTALHKAILKDSSGEIIELLLVKGVDMSAKDKYGQAVTHHAAVAMNPEIVKLLLEVNQSTKRHKGFDCTTRELHQNNEVEGIYIDINIQDDAGITLLHIAVLKDDTNLTKLLLSHGSNVNLKTKAGVAPLHFAVELGNWEITNLLLSKGASVNDKKENGHTALHTAVLFELERVIKDSLRQPTETKQEGKKGYNDMVELLLKYGADLNAQSKIGTTPLHIAIGFPLEKRIREAKLKQFLDDDDISWSIFPLPSEEEEDLSLIDYLECETPKAVSLSKQKKQLALIEILLGKEADLYNIRDDDGCSVIELALKLGYENIVKRMLEEREDVNYSDDNGRTVLMLATMTRVGFYDIVEAELNAGADVSKRDNEGLTALHHAWSSKIVNLLLNRGANINEQSDDGSTPLHCALRNASKSRRIERFTVAVLDTMFVASNRFDINIQDDAGITLLHIAVLKDDTNLTKLLLSHGSNVNLKTKAGVAPLHFAVELGNWEITNLLLSKGASVNDKKENGHTALHTAVLFELERVIKDSLRQPTKTKQEGKKGYNDMVELLLKYGANLNAQSEIGTTPLHIAIGFPLEKRIREAKHKQLLDNDDISWSTIIPLPSEEEELSLFDYLDCDPPKAVSLSKQKKQLALIEILLGKEADLYNIRDDDGCSVIELALKLGYEDIVKRMLEEREDVNYSDDNGRTVLMLATMTPVGFYDIVEAELNAGADVSKRDNEGLTALHHAWSSNIVNLLLNRGANINEQSDDGSTPLHCALRNASKRSTSDRYTVAALDTMFVASNRFDIKDNSGWTAIDYFKELHESPNINQLLISYRQADIMNHITSSIIEIPTEKKDFDNIGFPLHSNVKLRANFKFKNLNEDWFGDICSYDFLNHTYILGNLTLTVIDECVERLKYIDKACLEYSYYIAFMTTRLEQAKRMPAFLDEVSEMFANVLSDTLSLHIPTDVSHIILLELTPIDLINLNCALQPM